MGSKLYLDLRRRLSEAECIFVRQGKGSHEIWFSPVSRRSFTVPSNVKKATTANGILKDAGLSKAF